MSDTTVTDTPVTDTPVTDATVTYTPAVETLAERASIHIPLDDDPDAEVIDLREATAVQSAGDDGVVTVAGDRFEARRRRVERSARRRRLRRLGYVATVLFLAALTWGAFSSPWLTLQHFDIHPGERVGVNELEAISELSTGDRLLTLDTGGVARRIEGLPWVERASVSVRWPTTLRIRIVERRPVGVVAAEGSPAMAVVAGGVVAGPAGPADAAVVPLVLDTVPRRGRHLSEADLEAVAAVGALPATVASEVSGARLTTAGGIELDLRRGGIVVFGPPDQLRAKFAALETILGGEVDLRGLSRLDVSVPSAPTITR